MANPHKGEVEFEVGDKKYILSYSADAMCQLEEALNKGINEIANDMQDKDKMRLAAVRVVFWAGLVDHQPDMTLDGVKPLMKVMKPLQMFELIGRAFTLAFPEDEGAGGKPGNPPPPVQPARGTGPDSGAPGAA